MPREIPDELVKVAARWLAEKERAEADGKGYDAPPWEGMSALGQRFNREEARDFLSAISEAGWVRTHKQCERAEAERDQHRAEEQIIYGWCRRLDLPLMSPPRAPEAIDALGREVVRARAQVEALREAVQVAVQELPLTLVGSRPSDFGDGPSRAGSRLRLALRESQEPDRAA